MRKHTLVMVGLSLIFLLASCQSARPNNEIAIVDVPEVTETSEVLQENVPTSIGLDVIPQLPEGAGDFDTNAVGLMHAKVYVRNIAPGERAEQSVLMYNGSDVDRVYALSLGPCLAERIPVGYVDGLYYAHQWVTYPITLLVPAGSQQGALVVLEIPEDAIAPDKWEFRVRFADITITGAKVVTAVESRWFVEMK